MTQHPARYQADPVPNPADPPAVERVLWSRWAVLPALFVIGVVGLYLVSPVTAARYAGGLYRWFMEYATPYSLGVAAVVFAAAVYFVVSASRRAKEEKVERLRIFYQATRDGLTDLPNRTSFDERLRLSLAASKNRSRGTAVLFLDLDRFKAVNDTFGHQVGDELIKAVASRLASSLRANEYIARISGDEFLVVLDYMPGEEVAVKVAERTLSAFVEPFVLSRTTVPVSPSIGVGYAPPGSSVSPEELVREADTAMYVAKQTQGPSVVLFDAKMRADVVERLSLEGDLREALDRDEFVLHYQPIYSLSTRGMVGFEALVRWQHPRRGLLAPDRFIPIAEETRLVLPLGRWALREALVQLAVWRKGQPVGAEPLTVSVNLSARQLKDPGLVSAVRAALRDTGLPASALWLELTESAAFEDEDAALVVLEELRALGVRLSADDFGTGYSSLAYLQRYPIDQVKIDKSFVQGIGVSKQSEVIVEAVLSMADSLGLSVVAEGIETAAQERRLKELGCEKAQGFLFARPLTSDAVAVRLGGATS